MCFPVASKFLRTPILKNIWERLLLKISTPAANLAKAGTFLKLPCVKDLTFYESDGLVVKALGFHPSGPVFKTTEWFQG